MNKHDYHDAMLDLELASARTKFAFRETKDPVYLYGRSQVIHAMEHFSKQYEPKEQKCQNF